MSVNGLGLSSTLRAGKKQQQCSTLLGMSRETVCLEINCNKDADSKAMWFSRRLVGILLQEIFFLLYFTFHDTNM